jgi:heme/copper-type cytochrome/quinol oxidase subunit 2
LIQIETRARAMVSNSPENNAPGSGAMAWYDLFTTDYGLMSLIVIVGVIVIGVYMTRKFNELSKQPPNEQKDW